MLIDDHLSMGMVFKIMLTTLGCDPKSFDFCQDVDSATELLKQNPAYQIIFLDHSVPPTYHFRESLIVMDNLNDTTPVILFSGLIPQDFGSQPIDARINQCLEKDHLSPGSLYAILKEHGVRLGA